MCVKVWAMGYPLRAAQQLDLQRLDLGACLHNCDAAVRAYDTLDVLWAAHALLDGQAHLADAAQQLLPANT
jgi:hypothetical protein